MCQNLVLIWTSFDNNFQNSEISANLVTLAAASARGNKIRNM
jgi:hypothetical protein